MSEQPKECQTYTLSACTGHQAAQGAIAEMFAEFRAVGEALGAGDEETVLAAARRLVGERDQALKQAEHYCGEMVRRNDEIEIVLNQRDEALKRAEAAEGELWYSQHTVADLRNQLLTAKRGLQ